MTLKKEVVTVSVACVAIVVTIIMYGTTIPVEYPNDNQNIPIEQPGDNQDIPVEQIDMPIKNQGGVGWVVDEDRTDEYDIFIEDFENGLNKSWWYEIPNEDSFDIVSDPIFPENKVGMFLLHDYDRLVNSGLRSEFSRDMGDTEGSEVWQSWRFMLDEEHQNGSRWEILGQWHQQPAPGRDWGNAEDYINSNPVLAIGYHDGKLNLNITNAKYGISGIYSKKYPINKGEWHDIKFHIKWSEGSEGFIQAWIDGVPIEFNPDDVDGELTRLDGHRLYYPTLMNASGNYLKIGAYRSKKNSQGESIVYYDDVRAFRKKVK